MNAWLWTGASAVGVGWAVARLRASSRRDLARDRLETPIAESREDGVARRRVVSLRRRQLLRVVTVPLVVGGATAFAMVAVLFLPLALALSLGLLTGTIAAIIDTNLRRRAIIRVETQLAESLDLTVSALAAGAGPTEAIETATREAPQPLREHMLQLTERLMLGEGPEAAFLAFERSLPIESVRMLRLALSAHWEGGGSMGRTIASVARATRDRVALVRRVQGQSTEAQASVLGVIVVTYLLAGLMWSMDPARVTGFLASSVGSWGTPAAVVLQVLGLLWMVQLTRVET